MDDVTAGPAALEAAGLLADPLRRRLYEHVVEHGEATRAAASEAAGVGAALAAFHLDKLVSAGLLAVDERKASGRTGPGSGRPAKFYRRAPGEVAVSVPPRDYASAAGILADAVERAGAEEALHAAARAHGERRAPAVAGCRTLTELAAPLAEAGYAPAADGTGAGLRLRNCPFHALASTHPPLACAMNLELLRGMVEGTGRFTARMDPAPEGCCVTVSAVGGEHR